MRKTSLMPAAVLAAGFVGALLRRRELATAFEDNGLARPWAGITVALALLTALVAAVCAILAVHMGRRFTAPEDFRRTFKTHSYVPFAVMTLQGLTVTVCAVLTMTGGNVLGLTGVIRWVFLALFALSGLGMTVMAYSSYTQKVSPLLKVGSLMPSVFFCFWMVALYHANAGNPVILDYCYSALALGAASVGAYCVAGYAFGRRGLTGTVLMGCTSIYLLAVAVADPAPAALRVTLASMALFQTVNMTNLLMSLTPGEKKNG